MAAERGSPYGDGPGACPFVALEQDRDRRVDQPDRRHRCYAEPTPAPRAIAHQEAYCLSPNFPACPIFQDWAVRAAARPTDGGSRLTPAEAAEVSGVAAAGVAGMAAAASDDVSDRDRSAATADEGAPTWSGGRGADEPNGSSGAQDPVWPPPSSDWAVDPQPEPETPGHAEQLGAFDTPSRDSRAGVPPIEPLPPPPEPEIPPPPRGEYRDSAPDADAAEADEVPVPAFLTGRTSPSPAPRSPVEPGAVTAPTVPRTDRVRREDVVPSWEIDGRFGAEPPPPEAEQDRFGGVLTTVAVILILALGVAGVIFLPGLLAGGAPARTPAPSLALGTSEPSAEPSALPTVAATVTPTREPTAAPPSATSLPEGSPRFYTIRRGDSLRRIARRFDTTVEELLALNPEIGDPNRIRVGQVIVVPPAPEE